MSNVHDAVPHLEGFNPFSDDYIDNPCPMVGRMHREQPVFYYEPMGLWFISKYEDVKNAARDWETFSSAALGLLPPPADLVEQAPDLSVDEIVNETDPPRHTHLRQPFVKSFSPHIVEELVPWYRTRANTLIDRFIGRGHCDLMQEFCYPLSLGAIMKLFELPEEMAADFRRWGDDYIQLLTVKRLDGETEAFGHPMPEAERRARWERLSEANSFFREFLEEQKIAAKAPFIQRMLEAKTADGEPALSSGDMVRNLIGIMVGGHETTANLMGQLALLLMRNPDQWDVLAAEPALLENAIEETLRRRGSAQGMLRVTTRDVEVRGVSLPKGSNVFLMLSGAGLDEEVFEEPARFDIGRKNAHDHISFGLGRHSCLGNIVARMETRVAFEELLRRIPRFRLAEKDGVVAVPAVTINVQQMNIVW